MKTATIQRTVSAVLPILIFTACPLFGQGFPEPGYDVTQPHPKVADALIEIDKGIEDGPFEAEWDSLETYEIPEWYKNAKFGIFIHWGPYSVPAYGSEWYPRQMYIDRVRRGDNFHDHHIEKYGKHSEFGYKDFIKDFTADKFSANDWAQLFQDCGAKYVVPVAEHHDGFTMYDCSFTRWKSTTMGPKRDVVGELAKAVRARGMKLGVSSHRAFNWVYYVRDESYDNADPKFADLYGRPMPFLFNDDAWNYQQNFPPQDEQFKDDWLARTCELVDKYNPDLIWFDFGIAPRLQAEGYETNSFAPYLQKFAAYYYNESKKYGDSLGVINYKWKAFPESAAVLDKERSKMAEIRKPFWQTDTAVSSSSWGYTENQKYKTAGRLVDDLVDIVAKNGCLLLNVGPRADGTIPDKDREILLEIGKWLKVNGEAIYDTTYWKTFGEGPTSVSTGHVSESKDKPFTAEDIRFTTTSDSVYAILLEWPESGTALIKSLAEGSELWPEEIESVSLLGHDGQIEFSRDENGLKVVLPAEKPCNHAYVLKLQ